MGERLGSWIDLRWLVAGLLLLGLSSVAGVLASQHATFALDEAVSEAARDLGSPFEPVAYVFNELDTAIKVAVVAGTVVALLRRRQADLSLVVGLLMLVRPLLSAAKELVGRPRPSGDFAVLDVVTDTSFPSGHVMTAVVVWAPVLLFARVLVPPQLVWPLRAVSVAAVVLTAVSRMWAGVHWFSDTWGGVLWASALVAWAMMVRPGLARLARRRPNA